MADPAVTNIARTVEVPIVVRFGDTDPYGVVYCATYFRYCHQGIEEFFRHLGFDPGSLFRNQERGFGLPIVGASCDFLKPVRYGESLRLEVSISAIRRKALTFGFRFMRADLDGVVARGGATMVCIDRQWQSRDIPEDLRIALTPFITPTDRETTPSGSH